MINRAINSNLDTKLSLPKAKVGALAWDIGCYQGLATVSFVLKDHRFIRTIRLYMLKARWELTASGLTAPIIFSRMFGSMKRCARCQAAILASELVMRARDLVFHVRCFSCAACAVPLTKGDHFGMRDGAVLCRLHYEMGAELHPSQSPPVPVYPPGPHYPGQPFPSPEFLHHHHHHPSHPPHPHHSMHPQHPHSHVSPVPLQPSTPSVPDAGSPPKVPYFNGAAVVPPPRQKGRPRKRKPKDLEAMTANIGE